MADKFYRMIAARISKDCSNGKHFWCLGCSCWCHK